VGQAGALRPVFPWLLKLSRYVTVPVLSEAAATAPQIRKYSEESMQRYRSLVAADPYNVKPSLFTKLFLAKDEEKLTFNEVRDDAVTYIIAGSDTTAITLTYLVWCVTRDAALRDDLVREVQALPDDFSHQHVHHLPCLNMVIEETLRLYSPLSSALPRLVPREGAEIGGYRFPGGATVATQAYTMHRDPVIFPQPERFDPGRWAQPTKAMKEALLAFGGGSRGMYQSRCYFFDDLVLTWLFCSMSGYSPCSDGTPSDCSQVLPDVPECGALVRGRYD
jgi:cytochrome P450